MVTKVNTKTELKQQENVTTKAVDFSQALNQGEIKTKFNTLDKDNTENTYDVNLCSCVPGKEEQQNSRTVQVQYPKLTITPDLEKAIQAHKEATENLINTVKSSSEIYCSELADDLEDHEKKMIESLHLDHCSDLTASYISRVSSMFAIGLHLENKVLPHSIDLGVSNALFGFSAGLHRMDEILLEEYSKEVDSAEDAIKTPLKVSAQLLHGVAEFLRFKPSEEDQEQDENLDPTGDTQSKAETEEKK